MSPRQQVSFRPLLEALEDRYLPSGLPYPTAATVDQLVADINYADNTGGAFTINLQPSTTFALTNGGLPVVGGAKAVDLTILGNGGTIDGSYEFRPFTVARGASLTLDHVTLRDGYLMGSGGGIYNDGGTVTVSNSTLAENSAYFGSGGGIYNAGGWVTVDNSSIGDNWATQGSYMDAVLGAGIYNDANGTVVVQHSSTITGNSTNGYESTYGDDVLNSGMLYQDSTSTIGVLYGNVAIPFDPNLPELRIRDVTVTEGNAGTVAAQFTVTLSTASTDTITVAYATADGTATAGSDYQAASGTLSFAPGETSKTVTVLVNGDRLGEPNETFFVNLSAPTNATIVGGRGVGTIMDDEPRISIGNVTKYEGGRGQTTYFTFTVTLSAAYDQAVSVSFRTVDGTAKSGSDYVAKTGTLTFNPGETTKTITIAVNGDSKKEADETFQLELHGNSSNSVFIKSWGVGTILNDD
jgi:hypothetical protein